MWLISPHWLQRIADEHNLQWWLFVQKQHFTQLFSSMHLEEMWPVLPQRQHLIGFLVSSNESLSKYRRFLLLQGIISPYQASSSLLVSLFLMSYLKQRRILYLRMMSETLLDLFCLSSVKVNMVVDTFSSSLGIGTGLCKLCSLLPFSFASFVGATLSLLLEECISTLLDASAFLDLAPFNFCSLFLISSWCRMTALDGELSESECSML